MEFDDKFGHLFLHAVGGYLCYSVGNKTYSIQDDDIENVFELCEKSIKENNYYVLEYFKKNGKIKDNLGPWIVE